MGDVTTVRPSAAGRTGSEAAVGAVRPKQSPAVRPDGTPPSEA